MARAGEFELIARYFTPLAAGAPGAFGLSDDAAAIEVTPGSRLVVTADALVAGVHFMANDAPGDIAAKMLRVNLSDLAAMGAEPRAYLMTMALPESVDDDWLAAFDAKTGFFGVFDDVLGDAFDQCVLQALRHGQVAPRLIHLLFLGPGRAVLFRNFEQAFGGIVAPVQDQIFHALA